MLHWLQDEANYIQSTPETARDTWLLIWWFIRRRIDWPAAWPVPQISGWPLDVALTVAVAGVTSIRADALAQLLGDVQLVSGTYVVLSEAGQSVTIDVAPPVLAAVESLAKSGSAQLTGDVTLSQGANVTLTQVGQDIAIAAAGATGGRTKLFDSTLAVAAASIDTGAGGIATTFDLLEVYLFARTDEAVVPSALTITLNNDASAIYDIQFTRSVNATVTGAASVASAGWSIATAGASNAAGCFGVFCFTFPTYAQTVGHKVGSLSHGWADGTAANARTQSSTLRYRSTTAISRMKVAAPGGSNLIAGSRLLIYGT